MNSTNSRRRFLSSAGGLAGIAGVAGVAGLAGAQRVHVDVVAQVPADHLGEPGVVLLGPRDVHEAGDGLGEQLPAGDDDVDADGEGDDRVEPLPPGEGDEPDAEHDAGGGPHVGE